MNRLQWKDLLREIRKNRGRYLSLLFIVALGCAFYSGIRSSEPDMTISADRYYDETEFCDIRVVSTLGLTDDDLEVISAMDGIVTCEGSKTVELFAEAEDDQPIMNVVSLGRDINKFTVREGRLPERANECFVDVRYMNMCDAKLGDTITLLNTDKEAPEELTEQTYTIVGYGTWAWYLNLTRGTASIGDGSVDAFLVLLPEAFTQDYYTNIFATVEGAKEENTYSDRYDEIIDEVKERLEGIADVQVAARRTSIVEEGREAIADAKEKITDARQELADAEKELTDGEQKYADGLKEYEDGVKEWEDGKKKYSDGLTQWKKGEKKYKEGLASYQAGAREYDDGLAQYEEGKKAFDEGKAALEDSKKQLAEGRAAYEAGVTQWEQAKLTLEENEKEAADGEEKLAAAAEEVAAQRDALESQQSQVEAQRSELADQRAGLVRQREELTGQKAALEEQKALAEAYGMDTSEIVAGLAQIDEGIAQLDAGLGQIDDGIAQIDDGLAQIRDGLTQIEAGEKEIAAQKAALEEGKAAIARGWEEWRSSGEMLEQTKAEIEAGEVALAAGEEELAANEAVLADAKKVLDDSKPQLDAARKQLAQAKRQVDSGWKELADAKKELDDGEKELDDAKAELADARIELDDGWKEYEDGKAEADEKIADAEKEIADGEQELADLAEGEWYVLTRDEIQTCVEYGMDAERIGKIASVFPLIFFLVAALVSLTTMTRMIEEERMLIGTMKALGYGKMAIIAKYLIYAGSATILGGVGGVLLGGKVLPYVIMTAYGMLYTNVPYLLMPYDLGYNLTAIAMAMVCTVGAAFAACYRELLSTPAALMRPPAPRSGRKIFLEHVGFLWRRLNFSMKSTVRNLFRYKKRFFMTVIGIGGCMAVLLVSYGLHDSIAAIVDNQYKRVWTYSMSCNLDENREESEKLALSAEIAANEELIADSMLARNISLDVSTAAATKNSYLYVVESSEKMNGFLSLHDRETHESYALTDEGVILSEKLARSLEVEPGDEVTLKISESQYETVKVTAAAENYLNNYVYMTPALYRQVYGEAPVFNECVVRYAEPLEEEPENHLAERILARDGVTSVHPVRSLQKTVDNMMNALNLVVWVLVAAAGLLVFVVSFNLNNINISERRRELATLKVLGFYDMEVAMYVYRENIFLTLFGIAAGLFMGTALHRYVITTLEVEMIMFGRDISIPSYIYSSLLTMLFSIIVNVLMFYKLRRIDMVESLKSVE